MLGVWQSGVLVQAPSPYIASGQWRRRRRVHTHMRTHTHTYTQLYSNKGNSINQTQLIINIKDIFVFSWAFFGTSKAIQSFQGANTRFTLQRPKTLGQFGLPRSHLEDFSALFQESTTRIEFEATPAPLLSHEVTETNEGKQSQMLTIDLQSFWRQSLPERKLPPKKNKTPPKNTHTAQLFVPDQYRHLYGRITICFLRIIANS